MSYSSTILADSPLAYWKLDETTGATQFADSSGNSHPATISGTPTYSTSYKVDIGSIQTTGAQYGSAASGAWIGSMTSFSVEVWFSATTTGNRMLVGYDNIRLAPGNAARVFQFYLSNGVVVWLPLMSSGAWVAVTSPITTYNDGIWHHAVGTWDGTTAKLFVDGSQVASAALSGTTTTGGGQPILIGSGYDNAPGNTYQFVGSLDEVAIYGTALNSTQISTHWTAGLAQLPSLVKVEATYTESLISGSPATQIEATYSEALVTGSQAAQIEATYFEALVAVQPAQVEAVYAETVLTGTPSAQIEAAYLESVLTTTPPAQIEGTYLEVVLLPIAIPRFVGWGVPV